jgi:pimeloyl-ACP methyl ester carboxylesterase
VALGSAPAAEVQIRHSGLTLNARLYQPEERGVSDGVVLIVHDTLHSNDADAIAGLQTYLLRNRVASLAINLALGVDDRRGHYDCARPHFHRHEDAIEEISVWMDWLARIAPGGTTLLGYGRGANQAARYAAEHRDTRLKGLVMAAPLLFDPARAAEDYESRYLYPLAPITRYARQMAAQRKSWELLYRIDFLDCPESTVSAGTVLSYYTEDQRLHTPNLLGSIEQPMMVVAAGRDPNARELVHEVGPLADGERLQLRMIDEADATFGDRHAVQLANAVIRFMAASRFASVTRARLVD